MATQRWSDCGVQEPAESDGATATGANANKRRVFACDKMVGVREIRPLKSGASHLSAFDPPFFCFEAQVGLSLTSLESVCPQPLLSRRKRQQRTCWRATACSNCSTRATTYCTRSIAIQKKVTASKQSHNLGMFSV